MKVFKLASKLYGVSLVLFLAFWMGMAGGVSAQRIDGDFADSLLAILLAVLVLILVGGQIIKGFFGGIEMGNDIEKRIKSGSDDSATDGNTLSDIPF